MNLNVLGEVGLSEGEIKVYRSLLDLGMSSMNKIHEKTGMERRNIYDILNKLIERGLVSYIDENKKRTFHLASPQKIISYLEEKKFKIEQTEAEVQAILPELFERFEAKKDSIQAEVFRGGGGVKAVWDDMLQYKEIYWIGAGNYVPEKFPAFFKDWTERRVKKKISVHYLFRQDKKGEVPARKMQYARYLPGDFSGNPAAICVFGNKVAQFLFGEFLFVFVIESKELAENYKKYHSYLWNKVAKG